MYNDTKHTPPSTTRFFWREKNWKLYVITTTKAQIIPAPKVIIGSLTFQPTCSIRHANSSSDPASPMTKEKIIEDKSDHKASATEKYAAIEQMDRKGSSSKAVNDR